MIFLGLTHERTIGKRILVGMRIYAVADIHGCRERMTRVRGHIAGLRPDVLVVAGDICRFARPLWMAEQLDELPVPVIAVRGNSDPGRLERLIKEFPNIASLHMRALVVGGVPFAGIGGALPLPFHSKTAFRERKKLETLKPLVGRRTVLVAHPPPRGVADKVLGRFHVGSRGLRALISERRPRLLICGHIHEARGTGSAGDTRVVNCAMGSGADGALIELDGDGEPEIVML